MSQKVWVWLSMPGHTKPKVVASHATYCWWISQCKKSKIIMHYSQRYWLSVPQSDKTRGFWLIACEPEFSTEIFFFVCFCTGKQRTAVSLILDYYFQHRVMTKFYDNDWKVKKTPFWNHFGPFLPISKKTCIFLENPLL